jgi:hypothetical protein
MTLRAKNGRQAIAHSTDTEIARLVGEIRQAVDQMEALEEQVRERKRRLAVLLIQKGENWQDADGYTRLTKVSTRISYDIHALDQLILSDPAAHGWLKDYRRSFTVRGSVVVK